MKLGCRFFKSWRQIPFVRACGSCKSSNRSLSYFGRRGGNLENVNQDVDKIAQGCEDRIVNDKHYDIYLAF